MGQAARAAAAARQAQEASRPPIEWLRCTVCQLEFPAGKTSAPSVERLNVCQRCCVQDLAALMRSNPETVQMLPTVRALKGLAQVQLQMPSARPVLALAGSDIERP